AVTYPEPRAAIAGPRACLTTSITTPSESRFVAGVRGVPARQVCNCGTNLQGGLTPRVEDHPGPLDGDEGLVPFPDSGEDATGDGAEERVARHQFHSSEPCGVEHRLDGGGVWPAPARRVPVGLSVRVESDRRPRDRE